MTPDEHAAEAERLLNVTSGDSGEVDRSILRGIGHAILSLRKSEIDVEEIRRSLVYDDGPFDLAKHVDATPPPVSTAEESSSPFETVKPGPTTITPGGPRTPDDWTLPEQSTEAHKGGEGR